MLGAIPPAAKRLKAPRVVLDAKRDAQYFARAGYIFGAYKTYQLRTKVARRLLKPDKETVDAWWSQQHEWGGRQLYGLATDLQGFHLKGLQWLGARPDLVPTEWVRHLATLQDRCPPLDAATVDAVVSSELGRPLREVFASFDPEPVGSASIAQVHRARLRRKRWWRRRGGRVAVKVQRPGAERLMLRDLKNIRSFLSSRIVRGSLAWDADAILDQIDGETAGEFDFTAEAARMDAAAATLAKPPPGRLRFLRRLFYTPPVAVPRARAGLVTKRLLVMDFVSGIQLSRLAGEAGAKGSDAEAKMLFEHLGDAFGRLLFEDGFAGVHADPHPGNLLVRRRGLGAGVGLVDWGQTKGVSLGLRLRLARVVAALGAPGGADDVRAAIEQLGVAWNSTRSEADQTAACVATAVEWCDTRPLPAPFEADPTSEHYALTVFGELTAFPVGLIYYLRATQYYRAMTEATGVEWSLADAIRPHAQHLLRAQGRVEANWAFDEEDLRGDVSEAVRRGGL